MKQPNDRDGSEAEVEQYIKLANVVKNVGDNMTVDKDRTVIVNRMKIKFAEMESLLLTFTDVSIY